MHRLVRSIPFALSLFVLAAVSFPLLQIKSTASAAPQQRTLIGALKKKAGKFVLTTDDDLEVSKIDFATNGLTQKAASLEGKRAKLVYHLENAKMVADQLLEILGEGSKRDEFGTVVMDPKGQAVRTTDGRLLLLDTDTNDLGTAVESARGRRVIATGFDDENGVFILSKMKVEPTHSKVVFRSAGVDIQTFGDDLGRYSESDLDCSAANQPCKAKLDKWPNICFKGPVSSVCNAMKSLAAKSTDKQLGGDCTFSVSVQNCSWEKSTARVSYVMASFTGGLDVLVEKALDSCPN